MPDYIIRQQDQGQAEAEAKILASRPLWLWGQNFGLEATLASRTLHHCLTYEHTNTDSHQALSHDEYDFHLIWYWEDDSNTVYYYYVMCYF